MNYKSIYDSIITKSKGRWKITHIHENHHILPKCMGGTDDKDNIAILTAREHYICHWLLVKIYPSNNSLFYAFNMMTVRNDLQSRSGKRYEYHRRMLAERMSETQSGRIYVTNGIDNKRTKGEIPEGYTLGRTLSNNHLESIKAVDRKGKSIHSEETKQSMSIRMSGSNNPFYGKSHSKKTRETISKANSRPASEERKQKVSDSARIKREKNMANYNLSPNHCAYCETKLEYKDRKKIYCSISCSNKNRVNHGNNFPTRQQSSQS